MSLFLQVTDAFFCIGVLAVVVNGTEGEFLTGYVYCDKLHILALCNLQVTLVFGIFPFKAIILREENKMCLSFKCHWYSLSCEFSSSKSPLLMRL